MIDVKGTIEHNGLSQYRFAKLINRKPVQVWEWYHRKRRLSPAMEEIIRQMCKEQDIEIIEK